MAWTNDARASFLSLCDVFPLKLSLFPTDTKCVLLRRISCWKTLSMNFDTGALYCTLAYVMHIIQYVNYRIWPLQTVKHHLLTPRRQYLLFWLTKFAFLLGIIDNCYSILWKATPTIDWKYRNDNKDAMSTSRMSPMLWT